MVALKKHETHLDHIERFATYSIDVLFWWGSLLCNQISINFHQTQSIPKEPKPVRDPKTWF